MRLSWVRPTSWLASGSHSHGVTPVVAMDPFEEDFPSEHDAIRRTSPLAVPVPPCAPTSSRAGPVPLSWRRRW